MKLSFWESTSRLCIATILYFLIAIFYWRVRAPQSVDYHLVLLCLSILNFTLLRTVFKKSSVNVIGCFFIVCVLLILTSSVLNHEYFVTNFEMFQPYLGAKLLALSVALSVPPKRWIGWSSLIILGVVPVIQYYHWPTVYRSQLGFQEPSMTLCFIIIAAALYINRLHTLDLLKKEVIDSEKLVFFEHLGNLMVGLQHLNNTPLQTMELSLQLLRIKCPDSQSIIDTLERSYYSVLKVNQLLATRSATKSKNKKAASTIEEFEKDIREIGKYLNT